MNQRTGKKSVLFIWDILQLSIRYCVEEKVLLPTYIRLSGHLFIIRLNNWQNNLAKTCYKNSHNSFVFNRKKCKITEALFFPFAWSKQNPFKLTIYFNWITECSTSMRRFSLLRQMLIPLILRSILKSFKKYDFDRL